MATAKSKPFRTILDPPVKITTNSGTEYEDVIAMKLTDDGKEEFYVSGKTNVYEKTQADAENTNIEKIIAKVMATGDATLLQQTKGHFVDLTEYPKDIFEAHKQIREAEETFNNLPINIRSAYNNNFSEYLKDIGSEKWLELVGLKETKPVPAEPEPEQKGAEE